MTEDPVRRRLRDLGIVAAIPSGAQLYPSRWSFPHMSGLRLVLALSLSKLIGAELTNLQYAQANYRRGFGVTSADGETHLIFIPLNRLSCASLQRLQFAKKPRGVCNICVPSGHYASSAPIPAGGECVKPAPTQKKHCRESRQTTLIAEIESRCLCAARLMGVGGRRIVPLYSGFAVTRRR